MPRIELENNDQITPALVADNDSYQASLLVDGNDSDLVKISAQASGGATGGNPFITFDPVSGNGDVTLSPDGSGTVVVSTFSTAGPVVSDASGNLSVDPTAGGITWNVETGTSANLSAANGYFADNAGTVTFTLPATADVGDTFEVCATNATGDWTIAQNAGQQIFLGSASTTTGVGGSLSCSGIGDWVEIVCKTANTTFFANQKQGGTLTTV